MGDYISREAAVKLLQDTAAEGSTPYHIGLFAAARAIEAIPAADVRPVVRAAWQSWEQDKPPCKWYSCDYCGFHALSKSNFCPNCGAMMEES